MKVVWWLTLALCLLPRASSAETAKKDWEALQFLVGEWSGEGGGGPGEGSGTFSFATELQGKILVRKNARCIRLKKTVLLTGTTI